MELLCVFVPFLWVLCEILFPVFPKFDADEVQEVFVNVEVFEEVVRIKTAEFIALALKVAVNLLGELGENNLQTFSICWLGNSFLLSNWEDFDERFVPEMNWVRFDDEELVGFESRISTSVVQRQPTRLLVLRPRVFSALNQFT